MRSSRTNGRIRPLIILAALLALLTGCSAGTGSTAASSTAGKALTVGLTYTPDIQFAPFYVGVEKGFFADEGLNVTLRHHGASESLTGALQAGQEDVVYAGGDEAMVARSQGVDVVNFATMYQTYPAELIVPANSPITTAVDLKGHSVGLPGEYGQNWYALLALLKQAGLSQSDVDIQSIGYTQQAALTSNKVDSVLGFSNNDAVKFQQANFAIRQIQFRVWRAAATGMVSFGSGSSSMGEKGKPKVPGPYALTKSASCLASCFIDPRLNRAPTRPSFGSAWPVTRRRTNRRRIWSPCRRTSVAGR